MSTESSFDVRPMTREDVPAYLAFARAAYGPYAYQSQARYLRWLYETPGSLGHGYEDAKLAVDGGVVVGCIHKMRYRIRAGGELAELACPHNLFVNESHRHGAGLALIMESFKDEKHIFLMGVMPPVTAIYEKLRCKPIPAYWHRAILNPVTALVAYPLSRFAPRHAEPLASVTRRMALTLTARTAVRATAAPSAGAIARMQTKSPMHSASGCTEAWDEHTLRHRFFDIDGPRHLAFEAPSGAVALVSVGWRRRLIVARIVHSRASSDSERVKLYSCVRRTMAFAGVNVLLSYTTDPQTSACLATASVPIVPVSPTSYLRSRRAAEILSQIRFDGGVGDSGLEAIAPDSVPSL